MGRIGSKWVSTGLVEVQLDFTRPGKPTDNAHIESFNARLRAECLKAHVFDSFEDAEETLTSWRSDYNALHPHSAWARCPPGNSLNSVRGMQAAAGPNSSQFEWHQDRVRTSMELGLFIPGL